MGMYDMVRLRCPHCKKLVEFQSKAGECRLHVYNEVQVPVAVAESIDGEVAQCKQCGKQVTAHKLLAIDFVPMRGY